MGGVGKFARQIATVGAPAAAPRQLVGHVERGALLPHVVVVSTVAMVAFAGALACHVGGGGLRVHFDAAAATAAAVAHQVASMSSGLPAVTRRRLGWAVAAQLS